MGSKNGLTDRARLVQGAGFAILSAIVAELILKSFLPLELSFLASIGRVVLVSLSLYVIHRFALVGFRSYRPGTKDLTTLLLVVVVGIVLLGMGRVMGLSLEGYFNSSKFLASVTPEAFEFSIPLATGGFMLQVILGMQYGLVYGLCLTIVVGVYSPSELLLLIPYVLVSNCIGCLSLSRFRTRTAYLKAGLNVSVVAVVFVLATLLLNPGIPGAEALVRIIAAVTNGILCAFIAAGLTPMLEHFGGYVTDLRLIEMATFDHPLLKELSVQCPGTWNHSMVMGMMVEAAADSIGANPIVARVGAYFHDIGKMKKPLYFVENQIGGENRHDKLSTSMSALIIRSHVKDGIELAHKHAVPQNIEDMIPQHHGTSRIEFFYEKARNETEEAGDDPDSVDVTLYSYPGPKPQTKEAGILMLADGIEAAARTLSEPSIDRIQGLVQKMINKVFASGELDECELTLKDLHAIAKSFTRVLGGIYHQRIEYAEPAEKTNERTVDENAESSKDVEGRDTSKTKDKDGEESEDNEKNKEDLKRLGL